jgi:hypothetical protein
MTPNVLLTAQTLAPRGWVASEENDPTEFCKGFFSSLCDDKWNAKRMSNWILQRVDLSTNFYISDSLHILSTYE